MKRSIFLVWLTISLAANSQSTDSIFSSFDRAGFPCHRTDSVHIMSNGRDKFDDLVRHIAQAEKYVHVEYYKFWNDSIGNAVLEALAERAAQGVEVRLLYDAFGNNGEAPGCTPEFLKKWRERGVRMEGYDPPSFPYIGSALHRDHRKIVVIDGKICYTGGFNVADYYIHGRETIGPWRDMHMRMHGEDIAMCYERLFEKLWNKTTKEGLCKPSDDTLATDWEGGIKTYVVSREPGKKSADMRIAFSTAIDSARKRIVIVNPYTMHCRRVRKALYRALKRGVRLQYMTSYVSDHNFTTDMTGVEMHRLEKRGAEIYLYHGGFHHDKVMLIDDTLASVGTANMDCRSMKFDWEVTAFMKSPELTARLQRVFDDDLPESTKLTRENYPLLYTRGQRRFGTFMRLFKGLL